MIIRESAQIAANEIVSQAKALADEKKPWSDLPHPLYRFPELEAIAPNRRAAVVRPRDAVRAVSPDAGAATVARVPGCAGRGLPFMMRDG